MPGEKPLTESTTDKLLAYIVENQLSGGDKLPNEYELAQFLHVGRSTIREAVKTLAARNILEVRQGAGTFLSHKKLGVSEDPLGYTFILEKEKLARDLLDIRLSIEPRNAAGVASRATENEILQLQSLLKDSPFPSAEALEKSDLAFHQKLAEIGHNLALPNLLAVIQAAISAGRAPNLPFSREIHLEHRQIYMSIATKDPLAAFDSMSYHLISEKKRYLSAEDT